MEKPMNSTLRALESIPHAGIRQREQPARRAGFRAGGPVRLDSIRVPGLPFVVLKDVVELIEKTENQIYGTFGVRLEREIRILKQLSRNPAK